MSIDHAPGAGQQPLDQPNFRLAENHAHAALYGQLHALPHAQHIIHHATDNGHMALPAIHTFDSGSQGHEGTVSIGTDLPGRIVKAIGTNEGSLTRITRNDNGHGISVGIRQWNQERGELPDLIKAMHDKDPAKFNHTFGPYANNMTREAWVRHADMAGNPDLMRRLTTALHDPEFQQVQVDKAREFAQQSIETAKRYGLQTEQGAALVADMTNQLGAGGARRIFAEAGLHPGRPLKNEMATLQQMERLTHRPNSRDRFNTIASNFGNGALIHHQQIANDSAYEA